MRTQSQMNTQSTPGPWTIRPVNWGSQIEYIDNGGYRSVVAECYTAAVCEEHGSAAANARLIAAAPDLLSALQVANRCMVESLTPGDHAQADAIRSARAAIAKATTL